MFQEIKKNWNIYFKYHFIQFIWVWTASKFLIILTRSAWSAVTSFPRSLTSGSIFYILYPLFCTVLKFGSSIFWVSLKSVKSWVSYFSKVASCKNWEEHLVIMGVLSIIFVVSAFGSIKDISTSESSIFWGTAPS